MADKFGYTRIVLRQEEFDRLNKLKQQLGGNYHATASHSDAVKYLLDWYDKFVTEADTSSHDTAYVLVVDGVERDNIIVSRVVAELQADAIKAAMPTATVTIKDVPLEELIDE